MTITLTAYVTVRPGQAAKHLGVMLDHSWHNQACILSHLDFCNSPLGCQNPHFNRHYEGRLQPDPFFSLNNKPRCHVKQPKKKKEEEVREMQDQNLQQKRKQLLTTEVKECSVAPSLLYKLKILNYAVTHVLTNVSKTLWKCIYFVLCMRDHYAESKSSS